MKLMKAMKKLNFWSKKKRKKKDYYYHYQKLPHYSHNYNYNFQPYYNPPPPLPPPPPPPPTENCECHFCHPAEPSAPPLPPWLEEGISSNFTFENSTNNNDQEMGDHCTSTSSVGPTLSHGVSRDNDMATSSSSSQLQEIVTANTISGLGLGLSPKNKAGAVGLFGCVVDVGGLLFRCIFPCFHISEPRSLPVADHHMEKKTF